MDINEFRKKLGQRIKIFRQSKKYSQEKLCEIIGLEQTNLSNIETGKSFPSYETLFNMFTKAKMDVNFLFGFIKSDNTYYDSIDYQIMEMMSKFSNDTKMRLKNIMEVMK